MTADVGRTGGAGIDGTDDRRHRRGDGGRTRCLGADNRSILGVMTLIITWIRPEGVWQSADYRMTRPGHPNKDDTPKQLSIHCPPDNANQRILLAFTGLAEMPDGTPMLQWIRETVRGRARPVWPTLEFLRDRLTRDLRGSRWAGEKLVLAGGVLETSGTHYYVQIANFRAPAKMLPAFELVALDVPDRFIAVAGSGSVYVSQRDRDLLIRQANIRPNRWHDHLGLLAGVNRRAARADPRKTVSPSCYVSSMRPGETTVRSEVFRAPGDPPIASTMHLIVNGVDYSELAGTFMIRAGGRAPTIEESQEAGRRAFIGRP